MAYVIKKIKIRKATGPDQVAVKMIEAAEDTALDKLSSLLNKVCVTGIILTYSAFLDSKN